MPDYQERNQNTNTTSTETSSSTSTSGHEEQELVGNQAIAEIIRAQNNPTGERALNPNKNGIVYMGLRTMNLLSSMSKESCLWNDFSNNVKNFW